MRIPFLDLFPASPKHVLVADIGDFQVKYILARNWENAWDVLWAGEKPTELLSWNQTLTAILKEIKGERLDALLCSLPQTEFRAFVHEREVERSNSLVPVSATEARSLREQVLEQAETQTMEACTKLWTVPETQIRVPLRSIIYQEANGYPVPSIEKLRTPQISFRTFSVCTLAESMKRLEQIRKSFGIPNLAVRHSIQGVVKLLQTRQEDAIYVEVGEQSTQLGVIKKGRLEQFLQFRSGGGSATAAIERELGIGENSARDMKERYAKGEFSEDMRSKLRSLLLSVAQKWSTLCLEYLSSRALLLPPRIYFAGGASLLPEYPEAFASRIRELAVTGEPAVSLLLPESIIPSSPIPQSPTFTPVTSLFYGYSA